VLISNKDYKHAGTNTWLKGTSKPSKHWSQELAQFWMEKVITMMQTSWF